jgi:hypothetical protein
MMKEMVMDRYQLMAVLQKQVDNTWMELEELRLLGPAMAGAKASFGYGYMSSWLAALALKHPAVMQEMLEDPNFVKARDSLENAG